MKTNSLFKVVFFIIIAGLISLSCSPANSSKVTIHIDLGLHNRNAFNIHKDTIIDRVFRFFVRDAKAQVAPGGITSFGLTITGEGMTAINGTYTADTTIITLDVPAGPARVFQLTAYRPLGNYGGSATQDLAGGASVDILISMVMQYASVTINPAFPNGTPASPDLNHTVSVTTSGQTVLSSIYFTSGATINVPAGASKEFEVLCDTPSVTFRGTITLDLAAGSSINITPDLTLYETKIVIPDYQNYRIVQINDVSGNETTGWSVRSTISGISNFRPYDIDFDLQGRIYIANNYASTGSDVIIKIDSISGSDTSSFGSNGSGYTAIAIDRINNFVYCARSGVNTLWKYDLDGNLITEITLVSIIFIGIRGLAVDSNGKLYIAATIDPADPVVIQCTPSNPSTDVISYNANLVTPWDVVVKGSNVFVTNYSGANGYLILMLDQNLQSVNGYGATPADYLAPGIGEFLGPHRFLAILNQRFYLIDEYENFTPTDIERIVAFDDFSNSGWETFYPGMIGETPIFSFYSAC